MNIFYLPQLCEKAADLKHFFERELKYPLPIEDLIEIDKALGKVPLVDMKYTLAKTDHEENVLSSETMCEGDEAMLVVNLRRTNRSSKQFVAISNYPKPKDATWFLLVGVKGKNELLAMKRVSFKRFATKKLSIVVPRDLSDKLELHLMCDSYIGLDQCYEIDVEKINDAIIAQAKAAEDEYDAELEAAQVDPEAIEREGFVIDVMDKAKEHEKGAKVTADASIFSVFNQGFALFDNLQRDIVDDVPSDDEAKKRPRPHHQPQPAPDEDDDD